MARIVDLTLTMEPGMRGVEYDQVKTHARDGWNARLWHLYSHCGTHMDAPLHFRVGGRTIDQIPLDRCMRFAWVADLPRTAARALIAPGDLGTVADKVQPGDGLLLRTDWSRHAEEADYYRNQLPRVSRELAEWCVERQVGLLGVEPPSVADVNNADELTQIHQILLGGDVIIIESLTNLEALTKDRVLFMAFPLKLAEGDGSPVRALAIEGDITKHFLTDVHL